MKKRTKITVAIVTFTIGLLAGISIGYVNNYYHSIGVEAYLESTSEVTIQTIKSGWFFDGSGTEQAIIFYPGAKVETNAYAPLMHQLAERGIDCFLVKMPCNLAILGINKADQIMEDYDYDSWYLAGHSLGGAMAASYAAKSSDKLDGLIFLAAYSTGSLEDTSLSVLSIYGSEDQVVNMEKIEAGRELMPDTYKEICIEGGNHALFGSYGAQKGDGAASITGKEQIDQTTLAITQMLSFTTN